MGMIVITNEAILGQIAFRATVLDQNPEIVPSTCAVVCCPSFRWLTVRPRRQKMNG